jgi:hypothetical protein
LLGAAFFTPDSITMPVLKFRRVNIAGFHFRRSNTMAKHEEADLILKLYELRREPTMRIARDYYVRDFNPESMADITNALIGEHSGHLRMVVTYWDMAAALVNHGAIDITLANGRINSGLERS